MIIFQLPGETPEEWLKRRRSTPLWGMPPFDPHWLDIKPPAEGDAPQEPAEGHDQDTAR
jgi:hypothetical protein